jgi:hypothetical protein
MTRYPTDQEAEDYVRRKVDLLPPLFRHRVHWLLRPGSRWVRWPAALLFILGGVVWFLPVVGFWMLPLGLILLAEDVPPLRRWLVGVLMSAEAWWHRWRARQRR